MVDALVQESTDSNPTGAPRLGPPSARPTTQPKPPPPQATVPVIKFQPCLILIRPSLVMKALTASLSSTSASFAFSLISCNAVNANCGSAMWVAPDGADSGILVDPSPGILFEDERHQLARLTHDTLPFRERSTVFRRSLLLSNATELLAPGSTSTRGRIGKPAVHLFRRGAGRPRSKKRRSSRPHPSYQRAPIA